MKEYEEVVVLKKILFIFIVFVSSSCGFSNVKAEECIALPVGLVDFLNTKIYINGGPGYLLSHAAIATVADPNVYLIAGELSFSNDDSREYSIAIWEINKLDNYGSIESISFNASDYSDFSADVDKLFNLYSKDGSADSVRNCLYGVW